MSHYFFAHRALLPQGWRHNVTIEVDEHGFLQKLTPDTQQEHSQLLHGAVIPAMCNLHSHAFQRVMAGLAEVAKNPHDSFWSWRQLMYQMLETLTPEAVGAIATQLYIDMLKGGYTQVAEFHYLHHDTDGKPYQDDAMLQQLMIAAHSSGIGQTLLPVLYSYAGFGCQPPLPTQKRFIQQTDAWLGQQERLDGWIQKQPLINRGICFHSLRAVSKTQMREALILSSIDLPVHIHISEQLKEVAESQAWSGQRPVNWLFDHFDVNQRWCLIHATHLDDRELNRLAGSGAVAGLCPTTEANLGDGIFRGTDYLAQNGRWGIGSDSQVSLDVVEELRWFEYSQRLRDHRRNCLTRQGEPSVGDTLYKQACQGGAQTCGVAVGTLSAGYRADWLVLEEDALLGPVPDSQLINRWLFAGNRAHIRDVFVAGRQVIDQGQHRDQLQAAHAFSSVVKRLLSE